MRREWVDHHTCAVLATTVLALFASACRGGPGPAGEPGPQGVAGPAGPPGTVDYTRAILNGTSPQTASFNITGQGVIGGGLSVGSVNIAAGPLTVGGSQILNCTRVCGPIASVGTGNVSLYSSGALACATGFSLTGCSAYWASNSTCTAIQYPSGSNMSGLDDGAGACHALGYNGSAGTLESCVCATCCQLP